MSFDVSTERAFVLSLSESLPDTLKPDRVGDRWLKALDEIERLKKALVGERLRYIERDFWSSENTRYKKKDLTPECAEKELREEGLL